MFYRPAFNLIVDGILSWTEVSELDPDEFYKISYAYSKYLKERE
nr:MAG TPA: hypothetical protein [Caudoviricetes sp.]